MNVRRHKQAQQLISALELALPPVALALTDEEPVAVPRFQGLVPAGCAFWEQAASRTFVTSTADHELCSIGIHTHNLAGASVSQPDELKTSLEAMMGLDYVREDEVEAIPVLERASRYAVYGPLTDFPIEPDVVLVFAHAQHGLIITEAVERVDGGTAPAMGRPACAVVPQVLNRSRAAMSLGCCGARAYLDAMTENVAVWAFPASRLDEYCDQISTFADANRVLTTFHTRRRRDVDSGERPTVRQSLERLSTDG